MLTLIENSGTTDSAPNVLLLMLIFLPLNFLAATQDIAVDGWALTILSRGNSEDNDDEKELDLGITETYTVLWKILKLKPMLWMLVILLTGKIAFAATDGITGLKLIGMGMPKDRLASFGLFLTPLQAHLTSMDDWKVDCWTKTTQHFLVSLPVQVATYCMFVSMMAFNAQGQQSKISVLVEIFEEIEIRKQEQVNMQNDCAQNERGQAAS
ncbi:hypothetical protein NECAME_16483 [Necator americanus]|uniref:Uncharacterized protein n=1 Tax=Necator americanus TaxID=51031 RepID=W2TYH8_NECAM|nr:hypothetical protein NECAME_16483 [Necator americanus]ETN86082.1 hypothetical protein NECAME_16483 [Necator americanus]